MPKGLLERIHFTALAPRLVSGSSWGLEFLGFSSFNPFGTPSSDCVDKIMLMWGRSGCTPPQAG